ncbi:MAG: helix-turn-helix domain-containing protein [Dehalococcoidia bacterium]
MTGERPRFNDTDLTERWLTVYEVAAQLLQRPETVQRWIREGMLQSQDRGRLGMRIPKSSVDSFMQQQFQSAGFRSANHSLSSGMTDDVLTATAIPEQDVQRQGAGWPFRNDSGESEGDVGGRREIPGGS